MTTPATIASHEDSATIAHVDQPTTQRLLSEAHCHRTGSPPWPPMIRFHARGPNRYYLCRECGAAKEDVYQGGPIAAHRWHGAPDGTLPKAVRDEALAILDAPRADQLALWDE